MSEEFIAIILFESLPKAVMSASALQQATNVLEAGHDIAISIAGNSLEVIAGATSAKVMFFNGPMPKEASISSLGMADLPEEERERLGRHKAHVTITCGPSDKCQPIETLVTMLKLGITMCELGGIAFCLPASGICLPADTLLGYATRNEAGPRAWGVDDTEADVGVYERLTLWDSLRTQAEPDELLVGFVPAEIQGRCWFFSAGHTLFNLPELAYEGASLDEVATIRGFFRVVFHAFFNRPGALKAGQSIILSESLTLVMEELPAEFKEFQASTGTLLVRPQETVSPDADWD